MNGPTTVEEFGTVPRLLQHHAQQHPDRTALRFVSRDTGECQSISFAQLMVLVHHQTQFYAQMLSVPSAGSQLNVGVLASAGVEFLVCQLALIGLECPPVLLSARNSLVIHQHLLIAANCVALVHSAQYESGAIELKAAVQAATGVSLRLIRMPTMAEIARKPDLKVAVPTIGSSTAGADSVAAVIHTSGTTGNYPKLVYLPHRWFLASVDSDAAMRVVEARMLRDRLQWDEQSSMAASHQPHALEFLLCPLYHAGGLLGSFCALGLGHGVAISNQDWPPQPALALKEIQQTGATVLKTVPWLLEQLVETISAPQPSAFDWSALASLDSIHYLGSPCPQALGARLVENGASLVSFYGSSECGLLMRGYGPRALNRGRFDHMRVLPFVQRAWRAHPELGSVNGQGVSKELVILAGNPSTALYQSNTPEGDMRTFDLFVDMADDDDVDVQQQQMHPQVYKYIGRIDDLIVHVTGEKTEPNSIEHAVTENASAFIERVCVVGANRLCNCLLVQLKPRARQQYSAEQIEAAVWFAVQSVNQSIPKHSIVARNMILVLSAEQTLPLTPKGTVRRRQVELDFKQLIDALYENFGAAKQFVHREWQSENEVADWLKEQAQQLIGGIIVTQTPLTHQGLDSLNATVLHQSIREYFPSIKNLASNLVYQMPAIDALAHFLYAAYRAASASSGAVPSSSLYAPASVDWYAVSEAMFVKYSSSDFIDESFQQLSNIIACSDTTSTVTTGQVEGDRRVYLLTGATGSLGSFLLDRLLDATDARVVCAVRLSTKQLAAAKCPAHDDVAAQRLIEAFQRRGFDSAILNRARCSGRLSVVSCQLEDPSLRLGLSDVQYAQLASTVTHIIHNAWMLDFNAMLPDFEPSCIRPSFALLQLARLVRQKHFYYISSISSSLSYPSEMGAVPEQIHHQVQWAAAMGYGQSKLLMERLTSVFHDRQLVQSVEVSRVGQLMGDTLRGRWNTNEHIPLLVKAGQVMKLMPTHYFGDVVDWVPVDVAARAVVELSENAGEISSGHGTLNVSHLVNPHVITWSDFVAILQQLGLQFEVVPAAEWLAALRDSDPRTNPAVKLAHFFEESFAGLHSVRFSTMLTEQRCAAIRELPPVNGEWVKQALDYWRSTGFLH